MDTQGAPALPSFPRRVVDVLFNPGRLAEALAAHPAWVVPLLVGGALVALQTVLIPAEIWAEMFRQSMLDSGRELPPNMEDMAGFMRASGLIGGVLFWFLFAFLMAGVVTVLFAFFMGDEGRFKQYLAVIAHAFLIPAMVGLLLVPLRISTENPQLGLNVGSFFLSLPDGYLRNVLTYLDLSQLWAWMVVAQGAHAIDPRRSFTSAAVVLVGLAVVMALGFGLIAP